MKIYICACQFYNRVPVEKIATVVATCREADAHCEIVPDLCFAMSKTSPVLNNLDSQDVVLACQPRAVRALLGDAKKPTCVDLRTEPLDKIFAALNLTPAENPEPATFDELKSNWIPWFPVIDADRCVHCKKCVDFCMFGVYAVESGKVCVIHPESCKTDCPACARICPQNAIIFPKSEEEKINGSLDEQIKPSESDKISFRERLQYRKKLQLFKEDK